MPNKPLTTLIATVPLMARTPAASPRGAEAAAGHQLNSTTWNGEGSNVAS